MVSTKRLFNEMFHKDIIKDIYNSKLMFKRSVGIDKINTRLFEFRFEEYINDIYRKVHNQTYKFTPYKQKLFLKGKNKAPREVSIPTIRDNITLNLLKEILTEKFDKEINYKLIQTIVSDVHKSMNLSKYDYFIKIDIENFYGSINHKKMMQEIKREIDHKPTLDMLWRAIRTPTVSSGSSKVHRKNNNEGLPQGIPISNILSTIYLKKLDDKFQSKSNFEYIRYVDDILILCKYTEHLSIKKDIIEEIESTHKLKAHEFDEGKIENGVTYLGYQIKPHSINVRDSTIIRFKNTIENMFIRHMQLQKKDNESVEFFIWKLNLKITGSIFKNNKYGWVFFFSQITEDNESVFHILDHFVKKMIKRNDIKTDYKLKKFVRTYKEIRRNLHRTDYIPNFDNYNQEKKEKFLTDIIGLNISNFTEDEINKMFTDYIYSEIQKLEKDTQELSY